MQPEDPPVTETDVERVGLLPEQLKANIADELDRIREDLEEVGVSLCLDEAVMRRCMTHLQRLDELGQRSNWLAELIRAEDPVTRVDDITLGSLALRLKRQNKAA